MQQTIDLEPAKKNRRSPDERTNNQQKNISKSCNKQIMSNHHATKSNTETGCSKAKNETENPERTVES